jgi:hypothetical protein
MANANQLILVLITCALFGLISQSSSRSAGRQPEAARIRVFCPSSSEHNSFMFCELREVPDGYFLRLRFRDTPSRIGWKSRSLSTNTGRQISERLRSFVDAPIAGAPNSGAVVSGWCDFSDGKSAKLKFYDEEILHSNPVLTKVLSSMMDPDLAIPHWTRPVMPYLFQTGLPSESPNFQN